LMRPSPSAGLPSTRRSLTHKDWRSCQRRLRKAGLSPKSPKPRPGKGYLQARFGTNLATQSCHTISCFVNHGEGDEKAEASHFVSQQGLHQSRASQVGATQLQQESQLLPLLDQAQVRQEGLRLSP
jgi:hypothetical protein